MNIFISYSHADREFSVSLAQILEADGYDVFIDNKIPIGNNIYRDIGNGIAKADAIIIVISENYSNQGFASNECVTMLSFFDKGRMPLVLPVVIGLSTKVPMEIERYNYIRIPYEDDLLRDKDSKLEHNIHRVSSIERKKAIEQLRLVLATHDSKIKKESELRKINEKKVERNLSAYLEETMVRLKKNEAVYKGMAYAFYGVCILTFFSAIGFIFYYSITLQKYANDILGLILHVVCFLFIVILIISLSKLMFTLAKSFMVESIRSSDRIHAILFGKFFLDAYGNDASREEIIKAFSGWNIDDGRTSFRTQSGDDYDPKFDKMISEISGLIKKNC